MKFQYIIKKALGLVFLLSIYIGFVSCKDTEYISDLILSSQEIEIKNGANLSVDVLKSNGSFSVDIEDQNIVRTTISGNTIIFTANNNGTTTALVKDEKNKSAIIYIKVINGDSGEEEEEENETDLILSYTEIEMMIDSIFSITVLSSNGEFSVEIEDQNIVKSTISGNIITFKAISEGTTNALVKDENNNNVAVFITVNSKDLEEDKENPNDYSSIYYKFIQGSPEMVIVYVNVYGNTYAGYRVVHEINTAHNKNLWRVRESYMYSYINNEMKELYPILTAGENEFVWGSARDDVHEATGGYHGNERIDADPYGKIEFYADDKLVDISKIIPLTSAETFFYIQHSTMHETGTGGPIRSEEYIPVPGNPIECYHEKRTVFNNGGFNTYNKLIWAKNNTPVSTNNFALFCVTPDVSKIGYNESGTKVVFNNDGGMKLESSGSKIIMQNTDINISITCDSKLIKPEGQTTLSRVWDRPIYHKYYHRLGHGGERFYPAEGEEWISEASIHFSAFNENGSEESTKLPYGESTDMPYQDKWWKNGETE